MQPQQRESTGLAQNVTAAIVTLGMMTTPRSCGKSQKACSMSESSENLDAIWPQNENQCSFASFWIVF